MQKKCDDYIDELLIMPLFKGIKKDDMHPMLKCLRAYIKEYKKDQYIFHNNDEIDMIGLILKGKVQMVREDLWGNKTLLIAMKTGELFGETFACNANRNATVAFQASSDAVIIFLAFSRVMHSCSMVCKFHHRLIENMVSIIAEKNVSLMDKVDIISKKTLREKIYTYLLQEAGKQSSPYFEIQLGRVQLAEYLCADRSALTRELNMMREEGYIDYEKNSFHILKSLD